MFDHFVGLALKGLKKRFFPLNERGNRSLIIFNFGLRLYFGTNSHFKYLLLGGTFYGYCHVHVLCDNYLFKAMVKLDQEVVCIKNESNVN